MDTRIVLWTILWIVLFFTIGLALAFYRVVNRTRPGGPWNPGEYSAGNFYDLLLHRLVGPPRRASYSRLIVIGVILTMFHAAVACASVLTVLNGAIPIYFRLMPGVVALMSIFGGLFSLLMLLLVITG